MPYDDSGEYVPDDGETSIDLDPNTNPAFGSTANLPDWLKNIFNNPTSASGSLGIVGILGALAALNEKPQTVTGGGTTAVSMPQWYTDAQVAGIKGAEGLSGSYKKLGALDESGLTQKQKDVITYIAGANPITDYTDSLSKAVDTNQALGATTAATGAGKWQPTAFDASQALYKGGGSVLDQGISNYMTPYLENVLNPQVRRLKEDQSQEQQAFDAARVSRGAFGSSRADLMRKALEERQGVTINDLTSKAYDKAYTDATGLATADLGRQTQMGGALSGLAKDAVGMNTQDIQNLMSTGGVLRDIDQAALDKAYGEFQRQQGANIDWTKFMAGMALPTANLGAQNLMTENAAANEFPFKQNAAQVAAVGALKPGSTATTTSTSTGPTAGALSNLAGTGAMLWGLANPKGLGG